MAGLARAAAGRLSLTGAVFSPDGSTHPARSRRKTRRGRAAELGRALAERLLARGAAGLLAEASRVSETRVLVVRSGANPFVSLGESSAVEVVEQVEPHDRERRAPADAVPRARADLVLFTSQVAVERVAADPRLGALSWRRAGTRRAIAAVGPATAEALARARDRPRGSWRAARPRALLERLPAEPRRAGAVLLPCGEDAPDGASGAAARRAAPASIASSSTGRSRGRTTADARARGPRASVRGVLYDVARRRPDGCSRASRRSRRGDSGARRPSSSGVPRAGSWRAHGVARIEVTPRARASRRRVRAARGSCDRAARRRRFRPP